MTLKTIALAGAVAALATGAQAQMYVDTGIESGTFGEPFEDWALVQECIFEEEVPYCQLSSQGFSYWMNWGDPTPGYVLEAIGSLYVNDPVWIRADVVTMGDMSAEVAVLSVRHDPALDPYADLRANLQGQWVFSSDTAYTSYVSGTHVTEYVNGDFSSEYEMQIAESCEASNGQGPVMIAHINPWDEPPCMILESVSADKLIVSLAGGDGTIYKYIRP